MSITKQFLKTRSAYKVRFRLSAAEAQDAQELCVAGDFNGWDMQTHPMTRNKNGNFSLEVTLPAGGVQRFRYIADNSRWITDKEADGLEYCPFAQDDNSLLSLEP